MLLTDQIEQLVLKRDVLYARLGAEAPTSREAKRLEQEMQQLQDQRAAVENQILQAPEAI
jgi:predicted  nucleic acid-binding Zn-ribbon protein